MIEKMDTIVISPHPDNPKKAKLRVYRAGQMKHERTMLANRTDMLRSIGYELSLMGVDHGCDMFIPMV